VFEAVFGRIKTKTKIKTIKELCDELEISKTAIQRQKNKDIFLPQWAYKIGQKYGISTDWIMTGVNQEILSENKTPETRYTESEVQALIKKVLERKSSLRDRIATDDDEINQLLILISSWLVELKKENPKRVSWLECTLEDKIPEYKEWITKRRLEELEELEPERKIA
jgi:hypothetical protein